MCKAKQKQCKFSKMSFLLCYKPVLAGLLLKMSTQFIAATLRLQVRLTMDASKM